MPSINKVWNINSLVFVLFVNITTLGILFYITCRFEHNSTEHVVPLICLFIYIQQYKSTSSSTQSTWKASSTPRTFLIEWKCSISLLANNSSASLNPRVIYDHYLVHTISYERVNNQICMKITTFIPWRQPCMNKPCAYPWALLNLMQGCNDINKM